MTPQSNIAAEVLLACERYSDATAVTDGVHSVSYFDLANYITAYRDAFREKKNWSRLAFASPNSLNYLFAFYGALLAGKTPFLLDDKIPESQLKTIVDDVGINVVLRGGSHDIPAQSSPLSAFSCEEIIIKTGSCADLNEGTAVCRFSSGTSGKPKCLEFGHLAVTRAALVWAEHNGYSENDTILCLSGFYNGLAFNTSLSATLLSGATLAIFRGIPAPSTIVRYAVQQRATRLVAFPVFYRALQESPAELTTDKLQVTHFYSAASALSDDVRNKLRERFGIHIVNYYGTAETGPITYEPEIASASENGVVLPGCEVRLGKQGLEVKTCYMASGCTNDPQSFHARVTDDGFYITRDSGTLDNGRVSIGQRLDAILDVGGRKFHPSEVEHVLIELPGVSDAYVFGKQAELDRGVLLCALIEAAETVDVAVLKQQLRLRLYSHQVPTVFKVTAKMPRNSAGKLQMNTIKLLFEKELSDA